MTIPSAEHIYYNKKPAVLQAGFPNLLKVQREKNVLQSISLIIDYFKTDIVVFTL